MELNEYQKKAERTLSESSGLDWIGLCLAGEVGELANVIKKILYHGHPFSKERIVDELGDILWYVAASAYLLNVSLEDVAKLNLQKLTERYPEGFSEEDSINRKEYNGEDNE